MSTETFFKSLGWTEALARSLRETDPARYPAARVVGQGQGHYHLQLSADQTISAAVTPKLRKSVRSAFDFPTVGDWVTYTRGMGQEQATIHRVLERHGCLSRRRVGAEHDVQLLAANVDTVFIVTSANEDFDLDRLARYNALVTEGKCRPVLLLTKTDLCARPEDYLRSLAEKFDGVPAFALSHQDPASLGQLRPYFDPGQTTVLLGSSGVGKSTLTNYLIGGDLQKTQEVGAESRGRHTTTARTLRVSHWGGMIIDTPGMQDIAGPSAGEEVADAFADLEELTLLCKFTSCQHRTEPGCAVRARLDSGDLDPARWAAYLEHARAQSKKSFRKRR